jgi:hypothetical protein
MTIDDLLRWCHLHVLSPYVLAKRWTCKAGSMLPKDMRFGVYDVLFLLCFAMLRYERYDILGHTYLTYKSSFKLTQLNDIRYSLFSEP